MGEEEEKCIYFWRESMGKTLLGRPRHRWKVYMKRILDKEKGAVWTGLIWLRIGTSGMLF
jgi:hypothetical protein